MVRRIFCVLLITFGAALDTYFYVFRFTADGTALVVAIMAALALELLLAFAVWNAQKSKLFTGVAIAITLYAVVQTSAGQTFSLLSRDAVAGDTSQASQAVADEEKKNLERIDAEYATITKQMQSIQTVEDRAAYSGTLWRMTSRLQELTKARAESLTRFSDASKEAGKSTVAKVRSMSIYDFYASMPGWGGMDWMKFIFHTILSILIAIMTPIGLLTWDFKTAARVLKKSALTEKEIAEWVSRCWSRVVSGQSEKILSESAFNSWCERDGVIISPGAYMECAKRALSLGVITRDGTAVIKELKLIAQKVGKGN